MRFDQKYLVAIVALVCISALRYSGQLGERNFVMIFTGILGALGVIKGFLYAYKLVKKRNKGVISRCDNMNKKR